MPGDAEALDVYVSGKIIESTGQMLRAEITVTDASGRQWQFSFVPNVACTIGRAPDNTVVLDDPRASRYHAHINQSEHGTFTIIDGAVINGQLRRSANKVFINGEPRFEHQLKNGDRVRLTLTNNLNESTSIHFHGVELPNDQDGVPFITQAPVKPGETYVYEFNYYGGDRESFNSSFSQFGSDTEVFDGRAAVRHQRACSASAAKSCMTADASVPNSRYRSP